MNSRSSIECSTKSGWKLTRGKLFGLLALTAAIAGAVGGVAFVYGVDFTNVRDLEAYRPISNTFLYDDKGRVFGSFARERRVIAKYEDYPKVLYDAVLSIEDKDFERHSGFEVSRVLSAAYHDLVQRGNVQGASTLTMQLAKNVFLSSQRTYSRKIREVLLAVQIEHHFTKPQIFTLYANQIFLGNGVYGFATGADYYFGKNVKDITLDEAALLAAIPKAPNNYSPTRYPQRALWRRNLVINAMLAAGKISAAEASAAKEAPIRLHIHDDPNALAPYFVEEVRQYLEQRYGEERVHESGLRVYTTLNLDLQKKANEAVLDGLSAYERRHGWRAQPENKRKFGGNLNTVNLPEWNRTIEPGNYLHALVVAVTGNSALLRVGPYTAIVQNGDVAWTQHTIRDLWSVGDVAYVKVTAVGNGKVHVRVEEDAPLQGALLAIDNATGDVKAMVGGRDFNQSKFNRATQALRQVGSSFKPYVYTAAIDQGAIPEDTVVDSPVTFMTPSGPYSPHNYDNKFEGSITLRHALAESRNIPALKVAQQVGIQSVIEYAHQFGISANIPPYLPIALGAVELTLLEQTSAFSVFPNDGIRVTPRYIVKVTDYDGMVLEQNVPVVKQVTSQRTARIMTSMLREVVLHGTAAAANRLNIPLAGKTGTTNDFTDAWFVGFSPGITCGVWIGYDAKKSLGNKETGAMAALPAWMEFMEAAGARSGRREFPAMPTNQMLASRDIGQVLSADARSLSDLKSSRDFRVVKSDVVLHSASQIDH